MDTNNTQNNTIDTINTQNNTIDTNNTQNNTKILEECGPCPVFASYILEFALQLRKKHGKPLVRVAGECQFSKNVYNRALITIRMRKNSNKIHKLQN
jgi:hypothetical protein